MSTQSPEINKLAEGLSKAQAEITGALKDSSNPFFKSKYADLAATWDACRLPLSKNGLSVIQTTQVSDQGSVYLETTLAHSSGQWIKGALPINPVKNDPQGIGSAITYARRYALAAIVGVAQVDDDGEAAHGRANLLPRPLPKDYDGPVHPGPFCPRNLTGVYSKIALMPIADVEPEVLKDAIESLKSHAIKSGKGLPPWAELFIRESLPFLEHQR